MLNRVKIKPVIGLFVIYFIAGMACSQSAAPPGSPPQSIVIPDTTSAGVGAVPPIDLIPSQSPTPTEASSSTPVPTKTNSTPMGDAPADTPVQIEESSATSALLSSATPVNLPSPSQSPTASPSGTPNIITTPTNPVPEISTERLILSDDFNGGGPWAQGSIDGSFEFGYTDETYRFVVQVPNLDVWSIRGQTYANFRQDIVIASFAGATDGFTGVVCRWNGSNNYYRFTVDTSGLFRITRIFSAEVVDLATATGPGLAESENAPYRLRAECNGSFLALYLNDTMITSAQDNYFVDGNFGIVTGTLLNSPFTAEIDSFALYLP